MGQQALKTKVGGGASGRVDAHMGHHAGDDKPRDLLPARPMNAATARYAAQLVLAVGPLRLWDDTHSVECKFPHPTGCSCQRYAINGPDWVPAP